ncbi:hypothetical protein B0H14DRAFT_2608267 [Mycena olivaceomarginata]|nr:hypothetical protein B0H14DRAFT_2608267 [Mycena olivaceomarginata]
MLEGVSGGRVEVTVKSIAEKGPAHGERGPRAPPWNTSEYRSAWQTRAGVTYSDDNGRAEAGFKIEERTGLPGTPIVVEREGMVALQKTARSRGASPGDYQRRDEVLIKIEAREEKDKEERGEKCTDVPLASIELKDTAHARYSRSGGTARVPSCTRDGIRVRICAEQVRLGCSMTKSSVSSARDAAARRQSEAATGIDVDERIGRVGQYKLKCTCITLGFN